MEPKYEIQLFSQPGGYFPIEITRIDTINSREYRSEPWCRCLGSGDNLDAPLPCMWDGDTVITPINLSEQFPAEYEYLKAKFGK